MRASYPAEGSFATGASWKFAEAVNQFGEKVGRPSVPKKYADLRERIIANTVLAPDSFFDGTPCWWWIGSRAGNGRYGKMSVRSTRQVKRGRKLVRKVKHKLPHRIVRQVFYSEVFRRGHYSRHQCDPHLNRTLCCNPDHVTRGTPRQNNLDTVREGRHRNAYG